MAAVYTKGLNDEPGCRLAWVARLNLLSLKSRPPIIAKMRPLVGSIATKAACTTAESRLPLDAPVADRY